MKICMLMYPIHPKIFEDRKRIDIRASALLSRIVDVSYKIWDAACILIGNRAKRLKKKGMHTLQKTSSVPRTT